LCNEADWDAEELIRATLKKIHRRKAQYHSLGRKTKVALIGGAFNPPTLGHFQLAQFVLDTSCMFDKVWFVPCYQHLYGKQMELPEHRIEMCELMCQKDGRMKTFDYEIRHKLGGETYHFVKRLLEEQFAKDEYEFSIVIGLDNANTFDKWVNYEDLVKMIPFIVVTRAGIERDTKVDWYLRSPHVFLTAETEIVEVSSTMVRKLAMKGYRDGNDWRELVDPDVADYIVKNRLYGVMMRKVGD